MYWHGSVAVYASTQILERNPTKRVSLGICEEMEIYWNRAHWGVSLAMML